MLRWLFALVFTVACAGEPNVRSAGALAPEQALLMPPSADRELEEAPADADRVSTALAQMASVRGLPVLAQVVARVLSRAMLLEEVRRLVARDLEADVEQGQQMFLILLGLVPADFELKAATLRLMQRQLAGFYDPVQQRMFLLQDLSPDLAEATLAHELVHALQDQHFHLASRLEYRAGQGDKRAALHALLEGDATSAMLDRRFGLRSGVGIDAGAERQSASNHAAAAPEDVPAVLLRSALAPYFDGLRFVNALRRRGGWPLVNAAYRKPPASSAQVLHPEKYFAFELPRPVAIPEPPSESCELKYQDVLGEQTTRVILEQWLSPQAAAKTAAGWQGDRVAVFRCAQGWSARWELLYESAMTARRVERTLVRLGRCGVAGANVVVRLRESRVLVTTGEHLSCEQLGAW